MEKIWLHDNQTIKWTHERSRYCLHIHQDEFPENPREWDPGNGLTTMACWHRRYPLGDTNAIKGLDQIGFWQKLVRDNVGEEEILAAAKAGKLSGIRLAKNEENPELTDIYETAQWRSPLGNSDPYESLEYGGLTKESVAQYLLDDLTIGHCMTLMEPYAEWLPLWLYDHSGITMSCGARTGQFADRWDSGQVGWVVMLKETAMKELVAFVLDENGQRIKVEHPHEGSPSTWSYKTCPLTDGTWRARAVEVMTGEVELYDQYLTGEIFWYQLYKDVSGDDNGPDWVEEESCGGFYGSDLSTCGILDNLGYGLQEAVETGNYEVGEAKKLVTVSYEF